MLRRKVQSEIERLVERGYIESAEAEVLKERFITEFQKHTDRGVSMAKGLGGLGQGMQNTFAALVRETLDLPSGSELRACMAELERLVRESKKAANPANIDAPLHNPGHRDDAGVPFEVLPGVFTWSAFQPERGLYFNSYYFKNGEQSFIVDPVDPAIDSARNKILELGPVDWIVLTNRNHVRATEWLRKATHAKTVAHEAEEFEHCEIDRRVTDGEYIVENLRVLALPGKTDGEIALLREFDGGQLFIGDAIIGHPAGSFCLLPEEKLKNPKQLRQSVRNLLEEQFETLFLGDGVSILADASRWAHAFIRTI